MDSRPQFLDISVLEPVSFWVNYNDLNDRNPIDDGECKVNYPQMTQHFRIIVIYPGSFQIIPRDISQETTPRQDCFATLPSRFPQIHRSESK